MKAITLRKLDDPKLSDVSKTIIKVSKDKSVRTISKAVIHIIRQHSLSEKIISEANSLKVKIEEQDEELSRYRNFCDQLRSFLASEPFINNQQH